MQTRLKECRVNLKKRISNIKKHFRFKQTPTDITEAQEDKLRAIIALSHAEIEDYFETVALILFENAKDQWTTTKTANYNMASFFIRAERPEKQLDLGSMFFQMEKAYRKKILDSHGIKQDNIHRLFYPLGYENDDFDAAFLSQLDSFGGQRGKVVHTSASTTTNMLNQSTVISMIDNIITALEDFETVILSKV